MAWWIEKGGQKGDGVKTQSNKKTKTPLSLPLIQHALARGHSAIVPAFLSGDCVVGTLPVGSLAEAHNC